jgi:riboflavin biosynthesis pyrimidine reductase
VLKALICRAEWGLFGQAEEGRSMAQPVTAIFSHRHELAAKARLVTGDVNEAGLLVGQVFGQAFSRFHEHAAEELISRSMRNDLDQLIERLRQRRA